MRQNTGILYILTYKCASRHSGVQIFDIGTSKSAPRPACNFWFLLWPHDSAPAALTSQLFDPPDTRIIGKTQRFVTSLTFGAGESSFFWLSRYCIFFLLTLLHLLTLLSSDFTSSLCFSSAFQLSILSEVYYLNFLRQFPSQPTRLLNSTTVIGQTFENGSCLGTLETSWAFENWRYDMHLLPWEDLRFGANTSTYHQTHNSNTAPAKWFCSFS